MKTHTFTLLLGWLILLSSNLMAQNKEGRFKLKEGDWFEVEVTQDAGTPILLPNGSHMQFIGTTYLLNYQLKKQLPNNNQQYQVSIDHFKIIRMYDKKYYGYDSYYPPFKENKTDTEAVNQFTLEVTPAGKIIRLTPLKSIRHQKNNLTEIGSAYLSMETTTYSESNNDSILIGIFSNRLMSLDSIPNKSDTFNRTIPKQIKDSDMTLVLTDASFPLTNNAMVQGKLKDHNNQDISIRMIGENSDYYFPERFSRTKSDGSFTCPIFLKRPLHLKIQIGNKSLTTFMEAGDTLNISRIGNQTFEVGNNQYIETKPNEYFSPDLKKTDYFSGNAAYKTMLSNELDQYRSHFSHEKNVQAFIENKNKTALQVKFLIESYQGKVPNNCIEYFQLDFKYFFAVAKLSFDEFQTTLLWKSPQAQNEVKSPKIDYPTDFFLEVDTMPILMNPFEWNSSYQKFIERSQQFKQKRIGWAAGKRYSGNFPENLYFAQASLQGYPLYKQLAKFIDLELRKGLSDNNIVTPFYQDFINNCKDPSLTEPLKMVYETAGRYKIGYRFPLNSFVLMDSTLFSLENLKGKPICLILLDRSIRVYDHLIEAIKKFKPDEVTFLLAMATDEKLLHSISDTALLKLPNVIYIELPEKFLKTELLLKDTRIFMLDKWLRIVENNAEDPMSNIYKGSVSEFEKSLQKTMNANRYSKAEKSAILKTAGWSLGSILFTLMVGWWIYKIRVRQIKQQEEAKRRMKELEIKAIRSQMNPHFIFNALNSIQSLINGNQFKEANIYLSKFAVLLRGVLNNSEKSRVSLSDELQAVELYCQLEQLRFDFHFDISIAEDVNGDLIEIPGMIIQPLAENAVVHGISAKGNEGKLNIQVSRQNGHVCIGVADNGVGLTAQAKDTLSQKGFGLKLVEERINILNLEGKEARLTLRNRENNSGTLATLIIPID